MSPRSSHRRLLLLPTILLCSLAASGVQAQDAKPATGAAAPVASSKEELATSGPRDGSRDPVLAVVDGLPIRRSEMIESVRQMPPEIQQLPFEMVYPVVVDRLVDTKLIAAKGRAAKLEDDVEVKRRVAEATDRAIQEVYLTRYVNERVTEPGLRKRYDQWVAKQPAPREVKVRQILLGSEAKAKEALKRVQGGEDFAAVAREASIGPEQAANGLLGWIGVTDMTEGFRKAAFALKPGQIASQPIKTEYGYHVIKVEEERKVDQPSFLEMRERLVQKWSKELIEQLLVETRKTASIQRFDYKGGLDDKPGAPPETNKTPPKN